MKFLVKLILIIFAVISVLGIPDSASANHAVLSISPSTGTFQVDSTFEAPIYLDTHNQSINAVELAIKFPPDKLQLVSSTTGQSIIGIWATLPKFNNQTGTVELTGGVPGGIKVQRGLITTLTFRVKAVGSAVVKIERSKVLLHDGGGTELPVQHSASIYQLVLPPPAGPIVVSSTHPEQNKWYRSNSVALQWGEEGGIDGFSYILSDSPTDVPDDISEGNKKDVTYKSLSDGRHYFHIKGMRNGQWGGPTHYAINIDTTPPAEFALEFIPNKKSSRRQPVIEFETTDAASGINHYELKVVSLNQPGSTPQAGTQEFFIEAKSPYITNTLEYGKYDVIVRAYDNAGNFVEQIERLQVVPALFRNIGERGLEFKSSLVLPWIYIWSVLGLLILILLYIAYRVIKHHRHLDGRLIANEIPNELQQQLTELQEYRSRYGKIGIFFLAVSVSWLIAFDASAQQSRISPPIITTVSEDISNEEIFYAGGNSEVENAEIILYLENTYTAATIQQTVQADENGEWFYKHDTFLIPGEYLLWAQTKVGEQMSAPSPQVKINVVKTALQFGVTKLSYTTIYLALVVLLSLILIILLYLIWHHLRHSKKKHALILEEIADTEESIRRGFAVLNRDIQAELELLHAAKPKHKWTSSELSREEQLLNDLKNIEQYLAKEIWQIEETERRG